MFTVSDYLDRLTEQARGASVSTLNAVPVVLLHNERESDEDMAFVRWVHRTRRLPSITALRASFSKADVRLERKLRYEFATLRAEGRLRSAYPRRHADPIHNTSTGVTITPTTVGSCHPLAHDPITSTPIGGKRPGSDVDPKQAAHKRPRRRGNPAAGVPQTFMSSQTPSTPAT